METYKSMTTDSCTFCHRCALQNSKHSNVS